MVRGTRVYLELIARCALHVSLVAAGTRFLSVDDPGRAAVVGFFINALWWVNSSHGRPNVRYGWIFYGCGGVIGTFAGYHIAKLIGG